MRTRNGFTFIEFVIIVFIIGLLAMIAIPSFIANVNRANNGTTKANMHEVQAACEGYASQNEGRYTTDPAKIRPFMMHLDNPWTGKPVDLAWDDREDCTYPKGTIVLSLNPDYIRDSNVDIGAGYRIRGVGHDGKFLSLVLKDAGTDTISPGLPQP